jgi:hypothetical protein
MNIALKEWSAVIAGLDRGAQIFLLRKGGIVEANRGFEPKYAEFLLFPTFEHQHARYLKPEHADLFRDAIQPEGRLRITHLARITDVLRAPPSLSALQSIVECHIWNGDFIRQRYEYRPDLPLYLLLVRAYRLTHSQLIPMRPSYAGCKSWVHLAEEIPTAAIQPVLEEAEFARRRLELLAQLPPGSEGLKNGEQATE